MLTIDLLLATLDSIPNPDTGESYVKGHSISNLKMEGDVVFVDIKLDYPARSRHAKISSDIEACLQALPGVGSVFVNIHSHIVAHTAQSHLSPLKNVKNIIAVGSGKGGVGKSTISANLALALAAEGASVGLLDADIYGPSQTILMGLSGATLSVSDEQHFIPPEKAGVQVMSIGFMIDPTQPMIWRGPLITQAMQQLLNQTLWNDLDYLVIDLPPGTGDIQLTLTQKVPVTGAVIVTTPQDIALLDARKGLHMFEKVGVSILGLIENMSLHHCTQCGHTEAIFGEGGASRLAAECSVELLGQLPLDKSIRQYADQGQPTVVADPNSTIASTYKDIARKIAIGIAQKPRDFSHKFPKIVMQST